LHTRMPPLTDNREGFTLPIGTGFYVSFMRTLYEQKIASFLLVFLSILALLKLNQYFFYHFSTSPAVILMPAGVALAAVYLGGYRMWAPIAAAWLASSLTSPVAAPPIIIASFVFAYTLQALIGGYALKRLQFSGTMERVRCALILIGVALVLPVIGPTGTTLAQWLSGSLSASLWITWSRAWAGGVLSIMLLTPLITTWALDRSQKTIPKVIEGIAALTLLAVVTAAIFWTKLPQAGSFITLYLLFTLLFWIGLRMHPRVVSTALFLLTLLAMAGTIIAHPNPATPLNLQLLSDELFIILIAPIFFILTALVSERRLNADVAEARAHELEAANRKLSMEDRAKNDFLATLAHELRNPLAPVVSSLELIKMTAEDLNRQDLQEVAKVAEAHTATLTHLLDDLLDISRITQKKYKLQKESVLLHSVVAQVQRTVDTLYKSRGHTLRVSIPEETFWIVADALRLEQILVNLLNNAAKYTEPSGTIELTVIHDPERGLRFSIKDNGIGIEPHMLGKIFEPFIQSQDGGAGLGIGLSLTKRLVELHGGKVWAESKGLGKGSEFVVVLPVAQSVQLPLTTPAGRRRKGFAVAAKQKPAQTHNILIVDDNKPAAEGLKKLLEHGGHKVRVAYDGLSGIDAMRVAESHVVLLDIGLPGIDGYEVAKTLRLEHGYNPLILVALTGYGQDEDKTKATEAGFNHHLTKPVGIADIEAILAKIK
jgi:two-component system, sensor histidine kinase